MANPNSWIVKDKKNTKREATIMTGEWANLIDLLFTKKEWTYTEASEATGQKKNHKFGDVNSEAHKEALIAKARENAQDRKCRLVIQHGLSSAKVEKEDYRNA